MTMKQMIVALLLTSAMSITAHSQNGVDQKLPDQFPPLPYAYNALEPYIDATTMELHYSKHHQGYYDKFKAAIKGTEWEQKSLKELFANAGKLEAPIRNNSGGYYNHVFFWDSMTGQKTTMNADLKKAITDAFGSEEQFKAEFTKAALSVFGSGWAWLIIDDSGKLQIITTPNQDNPYMDIAPKKGTPLLTLDVWEHAYYLKYQNKRAAYVEAFWNVANWQAVSKRLADATN
jgi:Fe-Mn family superoxide dismutase